MLKHVSFVTRSADATAAFYTGLGAVVSKDVLTAEGFRRLVLSFGDGGKLQFFELPGAAQTAPSPAERGPDSNIQTSLQDVSDHPAAASQLLHPAQTGQRAEAQHAWTEHVAVYLPDLKESVARLRAQGVTFSRELTLSPGGNPMAFVLDPDGRQVELLEG
ncbi:VOC family protein [Deinococcus altitudinis]|uniref:VOC family protein n=1 Tax=Deinococcus altitudinis TaxID=468914 RepID=UPI00389192A3